MVRHQDQIMWNEAISCSRDVRYCIRTCSVAMWDELSLSSGSSAVAHFSFRPPHRTTALVGHVRDKATAIAQSAMDNDASAERSRPDCTIAVCVQRQMDNTCGHQCVDSHSYK